MPVPTEEILAHLDHTHERRKPVGLEWWRGLRWFTASALFVLVSIGLPSLAGYHWNLSRSLPLGLYAEVERPLLYCPREGIAVLETGRWSSDKG